MLPVRDGMVEVELEKDDVGMIAAFRPVLTAVGQGEALEIRVNERYRPGMKLTCLDAARDSVEFERPLEVRDGRAEISRSDFPGERLIVKLRQGSDLLDEIIITR